MSFEVPDKCLVTVEQMEKALMSTKRNKACGSDYYLQGWMLQDFSHILSGPLAAIFNQFDSRKIAATTASSRYSANTESKNFEGL